MNADDSASLTIGTAKSNLRFEWNGYDGDDSFGSHSVATTQDSDKKTFDFGHCATYCIRKIEGLLDRKTDSVRFGFRIPEVIHYDLHRNDT